MTKKENLYFELLKIKNEVANKLGRKIFYKENLDEFATTTAFRKEADRITVAQIEEKIKYFNNILEEERAREAKEAWFNTEEGIAYTQKNKEEQEEVKQEILKLRDDTYNYLNKFVKDLLGEDFAVTSFGWGSFEVALVEKYREDGSPVALSGHEFKVYFGHSCISSGGFRWEMNYGTLGSFVLGLDKNRTKYFNALAKFASSEESNTSLKYTMEELDNKMTTLRRRLYKLEDELKNPKIAA